MGKVWPFETQSLKMFLIYSNLVLIIAERT